MQVEELHVVLQQSFSPDAAVRKPAEEIIRNLRNIAGSTVLLLQVAAEHQVRQIQLLQLGILTLHIAQVAIEVRQAAAIQLKNICRECWAPRPPSQYIPNPTTPPVLLSDADRQRIQELLVPAILQEHHKSLRGLFTETLQSGVVYNFPAAWPSLVPTLLQTIQQQKHPLQVHNALYALRKICKRYEYKPEDQRGPLEDIVQQSFGLLLPLGQELVQQQSTPTPETALMLKQVLKIYWSCTQFFLPTCLSLERPHELWPWFDLLTAALAQPASDAPDDPWWKVKKWSIQITSRWFSRYGVPAASAAAATTTTTDHSAAHAFAVHFSTHVASAYLTPLFATLNLKPTGRYCTDRVLHLALVFVGLAVELSSTYKMLKPHLEFLLFSVCFPTLCLQPDDLEIFEHDPHEFINKQNSPLLDFLDPRISAVTLVTDMVQHRGQDVTAPLLTYLTDILQKYQPQHPDVAHHVQKDGALLTLGSLAKQLMAKPKYATELEGLLVHHVFPDFNSSIAFLRYRACWMMQEFHAVTLSAPHLDSLLQMVLQRMNDPALPVQIEASKALKHLVETDGADAVLLPILPQILTEYFRIMNEIGNDEVVTALQVLLDRFGEHLEPHAVALVTQLTQTFAGYCTAGDQDDDDNAALAAIQCLECMATVLKGVCSQPAMLKTLEPLLMPLVLQIIGNDGDFLEYLECALDILTFLTFFQDELSEQVWQAFPLIYNAFDAWAYDYLNMMVPCLLAYINKSPEIFLAGTVSVLNGEPTATPVPYMDLIVSMASKTISNEAGSEVESRYALSLFMGVLHNCTGRINAYLPYINEICLAKLGHQVNEESPVTRISIYQVLGSALYYDAQLELVELEKRGVTAQVFAKWLADVPQLKRHWAQKLTVLGFTSLVNLPVSVLPASVTPLLPQLIHAAVTVALKLKEEQKIPKDPTTTTTTATTSATTTTAESRVQPEEIGDVDTGVAEDEDVPNEADDAYRRAFHQRGEWTDDMAKFFLGDLFDDDGEDVDEDYTSPLDQVEELILLNDTIKAAFAREPEAYETIQKTMPPDVVAACQQLFGMAESLRAQAAATAAV